MTVLTLTTLEPRSAPVALDVVFGDHDWLTPTRRSAILSAFDQWSAAVETSYPPIDRSGYRVHDHSGQIIATDVPPLPADTLRVWVDVGPMHTPGSVAETGPVGYVTDGGPLERVPGWTMTFSPTSDPVLASVALHEAGHLFDLPHQPEGTPLESRTAMFPFVQPSYTHLTGMDYRDLLWSGHDIPAGTVITGIGTTAGGWMVYDPHGTQS